MNSMAKLTKASVIGGNKVDGAVAAIEMEITWCWFLFLRPKYTPIGTAMASTTSRMMPPASHGCDLTWKQTDRRFPMLSAGDETRNWIMSQDEVLISP